MLGCFGIGRETVAKRIPVRKPNEASPTRETNTKGPPDGVSEGYYYFFKLFFTFNKRRLLVSSR